MLKRKIYNDLLNWKNDKNKKCLIVKGARQVGKTYIIDEFCKSNYKSYLYINFYSMKFASNIFSGDFTKEEIIKKIYLEFPSFEIIKDDTIIFLDEIQACPNAITALKFLSIEHVFDVIASGSLMGVRHNLVTSFPVGYVDRMNLESLDFEEFLWAKGYSEEKINMLRTYFDEQKPVPDTIHEKFMELFKEYIVIGGMPEVVQSFVTDNNFNKAFKIQKDIIEGYKDDVVKYALSNDKEKILECFNSIPKQLAKDNKKFQYSLLSTKSSNDKYLTAIEWLKDADIISKCYNLQIPEFPLEGNSISSSFKIYMNDTGLLMSMMEDGSQIEVLNGNLGIYKGAIYENIIADTLNKLDRKLYYFEKNSTLEIDFFIRYKDKITAVEVKSADNTKAKSLMSVMNNYNVSQGIKLSSKNIGFKDNIYNYPLYMTMFIGR